MAKTSVVRGRGAFADLSRHGRRAREGALTVVHHPTGERARIAFAVNRRVGNAVVRNRLRRRLRALWAEQRVADGDYLVIADPRAATQTFDELRRQLAAALARLGPA